MGDEPNRDVADEQRRILDATVARDADRAVDELTAHIEHSAQVLIRVQDQTAGKRLDPGVVV